MMNKPYFLEDIEFMPYGFIIISVSTISCFIGIGLDIVLRLFFRDFLLISGLNPSNAEATFHQRTSMQNTFDNHPNPVILVFIWQLLLSTLR